MLKRHAIPTLLTALAVGFVIGCGGGGSSRTSNYVPAGTTPTGGITAAGQFVAAGALNTARVGASVTVIPGGTQAGKVLVAGGLAKVGSQLVALGTGEIIDPAAGTVTPVQGSMGSTRAYHGAAAISTGAVILAGGQTDNNGTTALSTLEKYEPQSNQFMTVSGSLVDRKTEPVMFVYQAQGVDRVVIAGGRAGSNAYTSAHVYRSDSNSISQTPSTFKLAEARYGAAAAKLASGKFLIQGGMTKMVELFDPTSETFGVAGSLPDIRHRGGVAAVGTQVAVIGGRKDATNHTTALKTIELFEEAAGSFTAVTASLKKGVSDHAVVALQNGDVLVIGGKDETGTVLNTTSIISGSGINASVTDGPNLAKARKNASAVLLPNGTVLIVGGVDANGNPVAEVEMFVFNTSQKPSGQVNPGNQAQPTVTNIDPNQGPVGTQVKISGTGFSMTAADNVVKFNGLLAPVQSVQPGATTGSYDLSVVVPANAVTGPVTVTVGTLTSAGQTFTVQTTGGSTNPGGTTTNPFGAPPHILIAFPSSGPAFMPVLIGGSNFADPSIPTINGVPSISLFNFAVRNIPLLGSISVGSTIVPMAAPMGPGHLQIEHLGLKSNLYPFTVN
ncbi:kelch repeat-containing protein [Planctomycetota bacterium]